MYICNLHTVIGESRNKHSEFSRSQGIGRMGLLSTSANLCKKRKNVPVCFPILENSQTNTQKDGMIQRNKS